MRSKVKLQRPGKGDLVPGHRVYCFFGNDVPAIPGEVETVSPSGHEVTVRHNRLLVAFGLPPRAVWSWRAKPGAYHLKGEKVSPVTGLALHKGPRP